MCSALNPDFTKAHDGLLPAVVQSSVDGRILMLGYMNEAALDATQNTGEVTFFSRSKNRLWKKGETSGNVLRLKSVHVDCDKDALMIVAVPMGPTCHNGTASCFVPESVPGASFLSLLEQMVVDRKNNPREDSYTSKLLAEGTKRLAQKVGEEGVELGLAAVAGTQDEVVSEAADLIFHLLVLLADRNIELKTVVDLLRERNR